ncbi:MAG: IS66 family transposase [Acidobacteria bacterium]|nr:IS66 family transposase [Acidobacteriota bacterium]
MTLRRELAWAMLKIQSLEAKLRKRLIAKYGPSSEKLSDQQLELLEAEPGVSSEEVEAEAARDIEVLVRRGGSKERKHPGRQQLPESLPRVEKIVKLDEAQCLCGQCGRCLEVIGYETSEQLEVEPAKYFVLVTKREKRACGNCGEAGVKTAPVAERIVEKGLASDWVVVDTVIAKYCDHLPLYRQSAVLERETEVEIHRATMDGWVMRVGELLGPVVEAMKRELLAGTYLQADETPVPVQVKEGRGKNHQAYLWQYSRPGLHGRGGAAVFDFQMGRSREGPKKLLRNFAGILQTDGYSAYDKVGAPGMVHAACWAHARRKFIDALKLNPKDADAARVVARMNEMFAVDAAAREAGWGLEERQAARREQARPLLDGLREELLRLSKSALPSSELGKGVSYTLSLWKRLVCFVDHAELELSNNRAENSMRRVALGRKNWIHVGSEEAGPKVAAILSIVETCKRLEIPVREYLMAVLPGMGGRKLSEVAKLTPEAWRDSRSGA